MPLPKEFIDLSLSIGGVGFSEIELVNIALNRLKKDYFKELLESFGLGDDEGATANLVDIEAIEFIQSMLLQETISLSNQLYGWIRAAKYPGSEERNRHQTKEHWARQIEDFKNTYRPKP